MQRGEKLVSLKPVNLKKAGAVSSRAVQELRRFSGVGGFCFFLAAVRRSSLFQCLQRLTVLVLTLLPLHRHNLHSLHSLHSLSSLRSLSLRKFLMAMSP